MFWWTRSAIAVMAMCILFHVEAQSLTCDDATDVCPNTWLACACTIPGATLAWHISGVPQVLVFRSSDSVGSNDRYGRYYAYLTGASSGGKESVLVFSAIQSSELTVACEDQDNDGVNATIVSVKIADNIPPVTDLTADVCRDIIIVQWKEPSLPRGCSSLPYTISVYLGDVAVAVHTVSTTAFAYHPTTGGGVYTIEVEVSHYSLISEAASITVEYDIHIPAVTDLQATVQDHNTIAVQWVEPPLLPGLSVSYTVSVYFEDMVSMYNVSTTNFTYHPTTNNGVFTISVRAFSDAAMSDTSNTTVKYLTDIFTTVPTTQYVWINDVIILECALNVTATELEVSVYLGISGVNSTDAYYAPGEQSQTMAKEALPHLNGAAVSCRAVLSDFRVVGWTETAYIYIQDNIPAVTDLQATVQDHNTIAVQWVEPPLLPGLSVLYTVSVYFEDTVSVHNVSTTNFTYYPTIDNGVLTISVRAFSDAAMSDATNTTVEYRTDIFTTVPITQYVWINDVIILECALNVTATELEVSVYLGISGVNSTDAYYAPGEQGQTIAKEALPHLNGAAVSCRAVLSDFTVVGWTETAYIYIQDNIPSVTDLQVAVQDNNTIAVQWVEPPLLPGLSVSYRVSVYFEDTVSVHNVSTTNFTYHLIDDRLYMIKVRPFNGTLTGPATTVTYYTE